MKHNKLIFITNLLLYCFVFISAFYSSTDPDLGWELKYGEYFFKHHQILTTNIFSTIMPNFYWVNHSWGADVLLYAIFSKFGFFGLTFIGAILITSIFYFFTKAAQLSIVGKIILFPTLLFLEYPINSDSLRPQLMSLFLFSILVYLIREYERKNIKKIFFAIPLFFVWANVHGEFILGLGIFLLWLILHVVQMQITKRSLDKKQILYLESVFVISCIAVLINPFGIGVYTESFTHFLNPNLQFIAEWQSLPTFYWWQLISVGILFFWSAYYLVSKNMVKERFPLIAITALLFALSLVSRRYVWPFYYLTLPYLAVLVDKLQLTRQKYISLFALGSVSLCILIALIIKSPFSQYTSMSWNLYCKMNLCSSKAAQYIIDHHLGTNPHLLTEYGLGGWLIWNYYPRIKPTIDGRMTLWIDKNGYNPNLDIFSYEDNIKDINQSKYTIVLTSNNIPFVGRLTELVSEKKWEIAYQDSYDSVFIRR